MKNLFFLLLLALYPAVLQAEQVRITTNIGDIVIELNAEKAPITVANFLNYVDKGAYADTIFHRVIPGFMVQGGGYYQDLTEADEAELIHNEADNGLRNERGTIAMARQSQIDSAGRQFFINVSNNRRLNHQRRSCTRDQEARAEAARERGSYRPMTCKSFGYAVFGKVVSGMDIVDIIEETDTHTVDDFDDVPVTPIIIKSIERIAVEESASGEPE